MRIPTVERCRVLLVLVDGSAEDPLADYLTLLGELEAYEPSLLEKERLFVLSKLDLLGGATPPRPAGLEERVGYLAISAVTGAGLDALRRELDRHVAPPGEGDRPGRSPIPTL